MALTKVSGDFIDAGSITQAHLHTSHGITTTHIAEGDKLFFTNARVDSRIGSLSSSDLSEGTNLYYTDARARAAISGTGSLSYNSTTGVMSFTMPAQNTSNITEGSNLYYTDARADARVALIVDSAPGTLNTLNELAAALGDDANFSTTVTNSIALKAPLASPSFTGNATFAGTITASGYNDANWNTAYGWGDHGGVGYLTSFDITTQTDAKYLRSNADDTASGIITLTKNTATGLANNAFSHAKTVIGGLHFANGNGPAANNGNQAAITFQGGTASEAQAGIYVHNNNSQGTHMLFATTNSYATGPQAGITLLNNGNVTIRGTVGASNFSGSSSGTNTGDQDLSSYATSATTLAGYGITDAIQKGVQIASGASWTTATRFGSTGDLSQAAGNHALSVRSENNNDAFMSFHIGSDYAVHFGLDGASNRMHVGGWSDGTGTQYQLYDARDFSVASVLNSNVTLATLGYTGATNANYITNNNQLTNGAGYTTNTGTLTNSNDRFYLTDTRGAARAPSYYDDRYIQGDFSQSSNFGVSGGDAWAGILTVSKWSSWDASHRQEQLIFAGTKISRRVATSDTAWSSTYDIIDTSGVNNAKAGYIQSNASLRAPIFYDSDDTNYYTNPAGASVIDRLNRRQHHTGHFEGSYNNIGGNSQYTNPIYTIGSSYNPNSTTLGGMYGIGYAHPNLWGSGKTSDWGMYVAANGSFQATIGEGSTTIWASNNIVADGGVYGVAFYDQNDTSHYLDPASTSVLNTVRFSGSSNNGRFDADEWGVRFKTDSGYLHFGPANSSHAHIYTDRSNFYFNQQIQLNGGSLINTNDIRAQIFYDLNDTNYYTDPSSTSVLSKIWCKGASTNSAPRWDTSFHVVQSQHFYGHNGSQTLYFGESNPAIFGSTLTVAGVIDANGGHGGINITNTSILSSASSTWTGNPGGAGKIQYHSNRWYIVADSSSNRIVQFRRDGSDVSYIDNSGRLMNAPDLRVPIYYDTDTTYYGDFASTSNMNIVQINGTLRFMNYGLGVTGTYTSTRLQTIFNMDDQYSINAAGTATANAYGLYWSHQNAGSLGGANNLASHGIIILEAGSWKGSWGGGRLVTPSDIRATLYYDYNNTAYYCDPHSTSVLAGLSVNNVISGSITKTAGTSGYGHPGTGMWAFYNWGGSNGGGSAPSSSSYTTGISIGSHPGDQAYGWQMANNMWNSGVWYRTYNSGFSSWYKFLDNTTNTQTINASAYVNGDLGVGFNSGSIGGKLNIKRTTAGISIKSDLGGSLSGSTIGLHQYTSASMNSGGYHMVFQAAPTSGSDTNMLLCNINGNLRNRNNSYGQYSDRNIKENITDATPKLEDVKKLKIRNFNFIGDELKQIGLIAQETELVFPGLVENDLNPQGDMVKSLKYSVLVPILIKAMQEQQTIIDDLKSRLETLENQ